jgi:hypothetical protein
VIQQSTIISTYTEICISSVVSFYQLKILLGRSNHPPRQFAKAYSNVSLVRQPYTRDGTAMQFGGPSGSCQG